MSRWFNHPNLANKFKNAWCTETIKVCLPSSIQGEVGMNRDATIVAFVPNIPGGIVFSNISVCVENDTEHIIISTQETNEISHKDKMGNLPDT